MTRHISLALVLCLSLCGVAPGESSSLSYDQAVIKLQELLNGAAFQSDAHTPANLTVAVTADDKGVLTITQTAEREQPGLFFRSSTHQTWTLRASEIDSKRVASRSEPLSVYAPIKKDKRLVHVSRTETKERLEGGHEPAEDWEQHDAFVTSFVSIPVASIDAAEQAAELLKRIAKTAESMD